MRCRSGVWGGVGGVGGMGVDLGGVGVLCLVPKLFQFPKNAAVFGALDACSACASDLTHLQRTKIAHRASVRANNILERLGLGEVGEVNGGRGEVEYGALVRGYLQCDGLSFCFFGTMAFPGLGFPIFFGWVVCGAP